MLVFVVVACFLSTVHGQSGFDMRPFIFPGVGNQGNCAGCGYAFAAVDSVSISSAVKFGVAPSTDPKKTGGLTVYNMYNMSAQQIIDCSGLGTNSINVNAALLYVRNIAPGITTSALYPYTGVAGSCKYTSSMNKWANWKIVNIAGTPTSAVNGDVTTMTTWLAQGVPLVSAINVDSSFKSYKSGSGLYASTSCSKSASAANHAVILVGYGFQNGVQYWIVRNSYGSSWGISGYAYVKSGQNVCGIENAPYHINIRYF